MYHRYLGLTYVKGKYIILGDFPNRISVDDSNSHEIIPISFNVKDQLQEHYQHCTEKLKVQSRGRAKKAGVTVSYYFG